MAKNWLGQEIDDWWRNQTRFTPEEDDEVIISDRQLTLPKVQRVQYQPREQFRQVIHRIKHDSKTSPLSVDLIDEATLDYTGALGMTMCPGRRDFGSTAEWSRDLDADLNRLRKVYKTDILVTMVTSPELQQIGHPNVAFFKAIRKAGIQPHWAGIPDMTAPSLGWCRKMVPWFVAQLKMDRKVVIHCRAGLGRTGALAGLILVGWGYEPEFAIETVRATRRGTIQTAEQEGVIYRYAGKPIPRTVYTNRQGWI